MSKLNKYLKLQLETELKKDAKDCIKIKNKLQELEGTVWSSKWNILVDVKFKGFPSDDRTYKPSKIGYIFLKGIEDNPVPSLDNIYEWMELNKDYDKKSYNCPIHKKKTIMLNSLFLMLNKLKQNGVETNNEQPKKLFL